VQNALTEQRFPATPLSCHTTFRSICIALCQSDKHLRHADAGSLCRLQHRSLNGLLWTAPDESFDAVSGRTVSRDQIERSTPAEVLDNGSMAIAHEPANDPIDDELRRVLADPAVRARIADFKRKVDDGTLVTVPHDEARRLVGLEPLGDGHGDTPR
jgi:hypothetical protein